MLNTHNQRQFSTVRRNSYMSILKEKYYFIFILVISITSCNSLPKKTKKPEETQIGVSNYFDSLMNNINDKYSFIYKTETELIKTNIYGNKNQTLININQLTSSNDAKILSAVISPKGTIVLVYYSNSSDTDNQLIGKILIYDLKKNTGMYIPANFNDYRLDWLEEPHWLDNDTFIINIIKWEKTNDSYSSKTKTIKYSLGKVTTHEIIELGLENAMFVWMPKTTTMLIASAKEYPPIINIKAIDINGIRAAKPEEVNYFKHPIEERATTAIVPLSLVCNLSMKIERVDENDDENPNEYIYLNDKIIRCSEGNIENYPFWEKDLELIIWYEYVGYSSNVNTYFMDNKGHYKYWFTGFLCGKILK